MKCSVCKAVVPEGKKECPYFGNVLEEKKKKGKKVKS